LLKKKRSSSGHAVSIIQPFVHFYQVSNIRSCE
jgi:hypothetical protein